MVFVPNTKLAIVSVSGTTDWYSPSSNSNMNTIRLLNQFSGVPQQSMIVIFDTTRLTKGSLFTLSEGFTLSMMPIETDHAVPSSLACSLTPQRKVNFIFSHNRQLTDGTSSAISRVYSVDLSNTTYAQGDRKSV